MQHLEFITLSSQMILFWSYFIVDDIYFVHSELVEFVYCYNNLKLSNCCRVL